MKRFTLYIFLMAVAFAMGAIPACGSDDDSGISGSSGNCSVHTDCFTPFEQCDATSQRCVLQMLPCDDQGNCLTNYECREVGYDFPLCMPVSTENPDGDEETESDGESCPNGTVLNQSGDCITVECLNNDDCTDNRICNRETYKCEDQVCEPACSDEEECVDGSCVIKQCNSDTDCSPDKECTVDSGRRICVPIVCYRDEVCRSSYVCEDTQCIAPCTDRDGDNPCETTEELCQSGHCIVPVPECTGDLECADQLICNEYQLCVTGASCTSDGECGEGRRCGRNDVCVHEGCYDDLDCTDQQGMLCDPTDRQCKYKTPTGATCADSDQCLDADICRETVCTRICDIYLGDEQCPVEGTICGFNPDGVVEDRLKHLCVSPSGGLGVGESCGNGTCELNLVCDPLSVTCQPVCNPDAETDPCTGGDVCLLQDSIGYGLCREPPCDPVENPCSDAFKPFCYMGECVECGVDSHCASNKVCEANECVFGCDVTGCTGTNQFCVDNRCEEVCFPACAEDEICTDQDCVPRECFPPCEAPYYCESGRCVTRDCRELGFVCEIDLWICNPDTGDCEEPDCPECGANQCCTRWTDYQCSDWCYTCHPDNPLGSCPELQYCDEGTCLDIPPVGQGKTCGALADPSGTPCEEGLTCCELFPGSGGKCCEACSYDGSCL